MKFEDKLAQLAFGDLSPEEAKRVEAQAKADPESARMLDAYRSMKSGLRNLAEVPDDQMSKERLRDAILGQGLKPERAKSGGIGWIWMPATAAVLAAGLMLFKNRPVEPTIALNPQSAQQDKVVLNVPDMTDLRTNVIGQPFTPGGVQIEKSAAAVARVTPRPSIFKEAPKRLTTPQISKLEYTPLSDGPKFDTVATNSEPAPTTSSVDEGPVGEANTSPIVMIEDNKDSNTGAFKATEVGASNVVIGG
jgi:hypothetical protein